MPEAASPSSESTAPKPEIVVYSASGGHKTVFSLLFLILLPFFVSLPAMFIMRVQAGLWDDAIGHGVMAIGFAILMFLVLIELINALRARIVLGEEKLHMTLPSGRGPTPMLRYKSYDIPYDQVHTVETRREIYGGSLVPVMLKGARIITKDGQKIPLGYVSEANVDPAFPYPEIAQQIAERARLPLIDRGSVWRSVRRKFLGWPTSGAVATDTVDETQIAALNQSHRTVVAGLIGGLVLLIAAGVVDDLTSDLPIGQTASTIAAEPSSKPAKPTKPSN